MKGEGIQAELGYADIREVVRHRMGEEGRQVYWDFGDSVRDLVTASIQAFVNVAYNNHDSARRWSGSSQLQISTYPFAPSTFHTSSLVHIAAFGWKAAAGITLLCYVNKGSLPYRSPDTWATYLEQRPTGTPSVTIIT